MSRIIALATCLLTLSCCSTPRVVATNCQPPPETMLAAEPLPPMEAKRTPQRAAIEQWAEDGGEYRVLSDRHERLAKWVKEHCQ